MLFRSAIVALFALAVPEMRAASPEQIEFFEKQVRPLFAEHCTSCHGPTRHENGLRLDLQSAVTKGSDYGPVIVPGNAAESKLIRAVLHQPGVEAMPKKAAKLSMGQITTLQKWVQEGAAWPADRVAADAHAKPKGADHWAFQKITAPKVPQVAGVAHPIDAFVREKQAKSGLTSAAPADAATLCRRLHLTVTGLLPTFDEVQSFTADHARSPSQAVRTLVDRLLASPHYGERWGRYWLDVARYSDTEGYQVAGKDIRYPYAYTYRDWVVRALNDDMPYDRFVSLQLAADRIEKDPASPHLAALGFLTVNDTFISNRDLQIDDRIDVVTRGMMALTVGCARCHDHKYDPIPTKDYYSLVSIFRSSEVPDELPVIGKPESPTAFASYEAAMAKVQAKKTAFDQAMYEDLRKPESIAAYLDFVHEANVKQLKDSDYKGRAGALKLRDRVAKRWETLISQCTKPGSVSPLFEPWVAFANLKPTEFAKRAPEIIAAIKRPEVREAFKARPTPKTFTDVTATYGALFAKHLTSSEPNDLVHQTVAKRPASPLSEPATAMETFYTRKDMETMVKVKNERKKLEITDPGAPPRAMVMTDLPQPRDGHVYIRGNPGRPGPKAPRGNLTVLGGQAFTQGSGRAELAQVIASRDNPLTARVIVNRVWLQHFGKPLAPNPSDFGVQTTRPEHADMLDYLAARFMDEGWSLKTLHRLILTSATFQQSSQSTKAKEEQDAENTLLTRYSRQRLDYEAMRDAIVTAAATLNPALIGGRSVPLNNPTVDSRRTIYHFVDRYDQATVPAMFDFANPDTHSPQRFVTTVPQQALFLMNSPFMQTQATHLSQSLPMKGSSPDAETVKALYQRVLLRAPRSDELELAQRFLAEANDLTEAVPYRWTYGTEKLQRSPDGKATLTDWAPLATFQPYHKTPAWSPTGTVPDPKWGHLFLTAQGGHAGDPSLIVSRVWKAPASMDIAIRSQLKRDSAQGDGVRGLIIHRQRKAILAEGLAAPGKSVASISNDKLHVETGDELHFAVSAEGGTNSDSYAWSITIERLRPNGGKLLLTDSATDFCGPNGIPINRSAVQTPLQQLSQALLMSNEFLFMD